MKLRIEKPIYGGAGLARHGGKAIFVPFTLPGELVEVHISEDHGSYADAELDAILEPSPERAAPPCPYFGECGGCHYQHATYPQQLEMKVRILREALERARVTDIPEIRPLYAEPLGYRNRIRLHLDRTSSKLCYKRRASHENLPVDVCPIAAPVLQDALRAIQSASQSLRLGRIFTEIEFFTNSAQDEVLLTLWSAGDKRSAAQEMKSLWAGLQAQIPKLSGAAVLSLERGRQQSRLLAESGERALTYAVAQREYRVSIGSFFQVNRFLVDPLVEFVTSVPRGDATWDLYAGVGLFSAALGSHFERVVAVEAAASSVQDLRHNLHGKQHRVVASSTLDFLRHAQRGREKAPDFVIVDPPRAGLGKEVTALLAGIKPANITYVSCDPATLSRDLKSLLDSGYRLNSMRMVDLFPQTFHLESVATFSLK